MPLTRTWRLRGGPSAELRANAGATRGKHGQLPRAGSPRSSHEISQAIRYLPSLLLPQLAWRRVGMERVMGIEPISESRQISILAPIRGASAIQVRDFGACGAPSGNPWQLTGTAQNDLSSP